MSSQITRARARCSSFLLSQARPGERARASVRNLHTKYTVCDGARRLCTYFIWVKHLHGDGDGGGDMRVLRAHCAMDSRCTHQPAVVSFYIYKYYTRYTDTLYNQMYYARVSKKKIPEWMKRSAEAHFAHPARAIYQSFVQ